MATKTELLNSLSAYDIPTLTRLLALADKIITPDEDQLVNVTFEQMVAKAHSLADIHFPQWTDRSKSDFGEFLVELMALFSEKDFWYINAFANEHFLSRATLYSSVYAHVIVLGYRPTLYASASGRFQLTFAAGNSVTIEPGTIVVSPPDSDVQFTNKDTITVEAGAAPLDKTYTLYSGIYDSLATNFNGRSIEIGSPRIDLDSVTLTIDGLVWTQLETLAESDATDRHFIVVPDSDGKAVIAFGNNIFGLRPSVGDSCEVSFRYNTGTDGNLSSGTVTAIKNSPSTRTITAVTQLTDSEGGTDAESIEVMRNAGSIHFRTQGNIIGPSDMKDVLESQSDIHRAYSYSFASALYFHAIREDGVHATPEFLESVLDRIRETIRLDFDTYPVETAYITISEVTLEVYTLTGYTESEIISQMETLLEDYTDPLVNADFGSDFSLSEITESAVESIEGVQNIVWSTVNSVAAADVDVPHNQILEKMLLSAMNITVTYV